MGQSIGYNLFKCTATVAGRKAIQEMSEHSNWRYFRPVLDYLGLLCWVFSPLMLIPLASRLVLTDAGRGVVPASAFWIPIVVSLGLAVALKRDLRSPPLDSRRAMVLCALGWIVISGIGAIPFSLGLGIGYLDAYFEAVSGFTTTGITMLQGLDRMPADILLWRSLIQWLGGLGILTFFLAVLYTGGSAHRLFGAESHKVFSRRPAPSMLRSVRTLWIIYVVLSVAVTAALAMEGMSLYDAACHTMTALSTGGYSPYDASIGYYQVAGYRHFALIEYTLVAAMILGGMSFFVHYRLSRGEFRALWDGLEMRLWWVILAAATGLVMIDHFRKFGVQGPDSGGIHEVFRASLFQVTSILTTTGFATRDIGADYFPAASKQVFLVLMIVGGCVGSTGGGIKVLRIGVLHKMVTRQIRRLVYGPDMVQPIVVDGEVVGAEELRRISALFFAWIAMLGFGGLVTALLSDLDAFSASSGMFSALGNIGPCYIPAADMSALHWGVKLVYILGMLAGRLEIVPLLLLFSRRTWK